MARWSALHRLTGEARYRDSRLGAGWGRVGGLPAEAPHPRPLGPLLCGGHVIDSDLAEQMTNPPGRTTPGTGWAPCAAASPTSPGSGAPETSASTTASSSSSPTPIPPSAASSPPPPPTGAAPPSPTSPSPSNSTTPPPAISHGVALALARWVALPAVELAVMPRAGWRPRCWPRRSLSVAWAGGGGAGEASLARRSRGGRLLGRRAGGEVHAEVGTHFARKRGTVQQAIVGEHEGDGTGVPYLTGGIHHLVRACPGAGVSLGVDRQRRVALLEDRLGARTRRGRQALGPSPATSSPSHPPRPGR